MPRQSLLVVLGVLYGVAGCGTGRSDAEVGNPNLRSELLAMVAADQALRDDLSPERMQDTAFVMEVLQSQERNSERMREILGEYGWPDPDLVGADGAEAAWLLVQHGGAEIQERALELMRSSDEPGVTAADIALLTDRILVERGLPQMYGSQFQFVDDKLVQYPVDDPDSVDVRRAEVGLPPMAEYVRLLQQAYGIERD
jgi:hypothetical protein